jgi:hypothetical protein
MFFESELWLASLDRMQPNDRAWAKARQEQSLREQNVRERSIWEEGNFFITENNWVEVEDYILSMSSWWLALDNNNWK